MSHSSTAVLKVREVIERLMSDGTAISRLDNSVHNLFPIGISSAEGESLRDWVSRENPIQSIEIGLAYGISALYICEGLLLTGNEPKRHVVVDPYQSTGFKDCGLQFLADAGVMDLIEHHSKPSEIVLPQFLVEGQRFDFAFVEGSHLFDAVILDLIYLGRLVKPSGVVFVDDYQLPAIVKAASFCLKNLGWDLEEVSAADDLHQWAVFRTPSETVRRSFPHFVDF